MGPFGGIGLPEIIIVLVIVLVIFGPKRLPGLGRSLGSGLREFKDSVSSKDSGSSHPEIAESPEHRKDAPVAEPDPGAEDREPVSAQSVPDPRGTAPAQDRTP